MMLKETGIEKNAQIMTAETKCYSLGNWQTDRGIVLCAV